MDFNMFQKHKLATMVEGKTKEEKFFNLGAKDK